MYNTDILIRTIKTRYNINQDDNSIRIKNIDGYPHVFALDFGNCSYIAKLIKLSKIYCKDINRFYNDINDNNFILIPKKTKDDKYSIEYSNMLALLYDRLNNYGTKPDYLWWSKCLASIHSTEPNDNNLVSYRSDIYNETMNLLEKSSIYMDDDIKNKVNLIFSKVQPKKLKDDNDFVLCHNDPYDQNVLIMNKMYKMIDTDGMGLSKKEYDIQRLLYNYAISCDNVAEVERFFKFFKKEYETITNKKIDIELFKNLYYCDLIRSISWLYLVSNDNTRDDFDRQKKQLLLYKKSIRNNIHELFINQL